MAESAARLLTLLTLLQTRPQWTGPELAERLAVTERTLRRDVDRLRDLGYPIHATRGVTGGYHLGAGRALPPLLLDDDEATAIVIALRTVAGSGMTAALGALAKLEQVLPTRLRPRVAALQHATLALPRSMADPDVLATLAAACRHLHRVRFGYTDHHGRPSARHTEPHRLVYNGRNWYLVARDLDRTAWRAFRVDRITDPHDTAVRFTPHDPPDAAGFVAESVASAPYRHHARILLRVSASVAVQRFPPTSGAIEPLDDHTCVLTAGADSLDAIAVHLGFADVEFAVLDPPELRDRLTAIAARFGHAVTTVDMP